jgi:type I restriction enzyme M protein
VLHATKADVLAQADKVATMGLPEEAEEKMLLRAAGLSFFNTSKMDLS